jgi:hypothetical protein
MPGANRDDDHLALLPETIKFLVREPAVSVEEYRGLPDGPGVFALWLSDSDAWREICLIPHRPRRPLFMGAARDLYARVDGCLTGAGSPAAELRRHLEVLLHACGASDASEAAVLGPLVPRAIADGLSSLPGAALGEAALTQWMLCELHITWAPARSLPEAVSLARIGSDLLGAPLSRVGLPTPGSFLTTEGRSALGARAQLIDDARAGRVRGDLSRDLSDTDLAAFFAASGQLWPFYDDEASLALLEMLGDQWPVVPRAAQIRTRRALAEGGSEASDAEVLRAALVRSWD